MLKTSARGSAVLFLGQIAAAIVVAAAEILVARYLGSARYGVQAIAFIPINVAVLFADLGVNSTIVKSVAQLRHEGKAGDVPLLVKTGLLLNVGVSAALALIVYLLGGYLAANAFHNPDLGPLIEVASLSIVGQALLNTCYAVFVGFERMKLHSGTYLAYSLLKSLLAPALVYVGYGAYGAVLGQTLSLVLGGAVGLSLVALTLRREPVSDSGMTLPEAARFIVATGYPVLLSNILTGGVVQVNTFVLALYASESMVGNYNAALKFGVLLGFFTMPLSTVLFPLFSKIGPDDREALSLVFQRAVKYAALVTYPVIAALVALSAPVTRILLRGSFTSTPLFLQLYMLNFLFLGMGSGAIDSFLLGIHQRGVYLRSVTLYFAAGVVLGLALIPTYGVVGLIATQLIAPRVSHVNSLIWVKRNLGFSVDWSSSLRLLVSAGFAYLGAYLFVQYTDLNPYVEVAAGGLVTVAVYAASVILTKALTRQDLAEIRSIARNLGPLSPLVMPALEIVDRLVGMRG